MARLLEATPGGASSVDRVLDLTSGNPLLVGELVRHLAGGGGFDSVPHTVRDSVAARVARLDPATAGALRVAAVIGRDFAVGLVATVLGVPVMVVLEAVDRAVAAGLVTTTPTPGRFRFVHALVCEAVVACVPAAHRPGLHRAVAVAIEQYDGTGDDHVGELARHWDPAGERSDVAAHWSERAAAAADRRLAWEQAARLYDRAVELPSTSGGDSARYRRSIGAARAHLHADAMAVALERCGAAAAAAWALDRPELVAEAVLIHEDRGGPVVAELVDDADRALDALPPGARALRARLLGLLATAAFYTDPAECEALSARAVAEADDAADPVAVIGAVRARQVACARPGGEAELLQLAQRMGAAGRALRRPSVLWQPLWRIDALLASGLVPEAVAEVSAVRRLTDQVGLPIARWHRWRVEAIAAQATARFADAMRAGDAARELFASVEDPLGAEAMWCALRTSVELHTGHTGDTAERWDRLDLELSPPFIADLSLLGPIVTFAHTGREEAARRLYARLAPVPAWRPPPFLTVAMHVLRTQAATAVGRLDDLPALVARLERWRGLHAAAATGSVTYHGPVELWSGEARLALGDHAGAAVELRTALAASTTAATPGFTVQAAAALAEAVDRSGGPADEVRSLVEEHRPLALALGMEPSVARCDALTARLDAGRDRGPLSAREHEVAALVARGLTNRAIAAELFASERTAQNHVQHILTKLAVRNRTQIAAWYDHRSTP